MKPAVRIISFFIATAAVVPSYARTDVEIFAGINRTSMSGVGIHPGETDKRIGYAGGASIHKRGKLLGFMTGASLATRGETNSATYTDGTWSQALRLSYVRIPAAVTLTPVPQLSLFIGPELGILLSAELEEEISGPFSASHTTDMSDDLLPVDAGLTLGATWMPVAGLSITLRYSNGMLDINNASVEYDEYYEEEPDPLPSIKNSSLSLLVGYRFRIPG